MSGKGDWFQRLENTWETQGVHQKLALCEEDVKKSDLDKLIKASNNNNLNGGTLGLSKDALRSHRLFIEQSQS